ncbi:MAG: winged helix-turn-helix domain-containing protein [Myxococcales bacterium]|nr:winged helix-turn-helix domain-containing protein [Myxococcales bacterium]
MPERAIVTHELARLLGVLAHPQRIQIVEELRAGELDVNSIRALLGVSASRVSQHLALMRSHHVVHERREGRHHYYSLVRSDMASWLLGALKFIEPSPDKAQHMRSVVAHVREMWSMDDDADAVEATADATPASKR